MFTDHFVVVLGADLRIKEETYHHSHTPHICMTVGPLTSLTWRLVHVRHVMIDYTACACSLCNITLVSVNQNDSDMTKTNVREANIKVCMLLALLLKVCKPFILSRNIPIELSEGCV